MTNPPRLKPPASRSSKSQIPNPKSEILLGFLGLGIMGSAMAANLLKAGHKLVVWNRTPAKARPLVAQGAILADSPADLAARKPSIIFINVTDTPDVQQILFGPQGIARTPGIAPGLIIVDHSTISPAATRQFAQRLARRNITFLDAPVSGGDAGARNATLSMMVGGPKPAFQRCLPIFQKVARTITHLGPAGMGQVCKACNQIAVTVNLLGVCEAMALAQRSGLDLEKMIQVVSAGAGASWQLANLGPKIAHNDMAPGFMIDLVIKDLNLITEAAHRLELPIPAAKLAQKYFRAAAADGAGKLGTQAISKAVEKSGRFRFAG